MTTFEVMCAHWTVGGVPILVTLEGRNGPGNVVKVSGSAARRVVECKFENVTVILRGGVAPFVTAEDPGTTRPKKEYSLPDPNVGMTHFTFKAAPASDAGADDGAIASSARAFLTKQLLADPAQLKERKLHGPARSHVERKLDITLKYRKAWFRRLVRELKAEICHHHGIGLQLPIYGDVQYIPTAGPYMSDGEDDGQPIGEVSIYHTPSGAQHSVVRVDVPHSDGHDEFNDDSESDVEEQEPIQIFYDSV